LIDHILRETNPTHLFNVRFRQEQVDIYDPLLLAARQDVVWKLNRYTLAAASEATFNQWHRKGSNIPPLIKTITRKGTPTVSYNPLHQRLQKDLLSLLQQRYGRTNVVRERDYVDISVIDGVTTLLIEIKTHPVVRAAIREAIDQLLEYAYYRGSKKSRAVQLVIVAPGKPHQLDEEFIRRLNSDFKIPIRYASFSEGGPLPELFRKSWA
jgi:hypothetical protein